MVLRVCTPHGKEVDDHHLTSQGAQAELFSINGSEWLVRDFFTWQLADPGLAPRLRPGVKPSQYQKPDREQQRFSSHIFSQWPRPGTKSTRDACAPRLG